MDLGAFLGGLGTLLEKLGELAEKGEQLSKTGELRGLDREGKLHGIYGLNVKVGLGGEGIKVEPFGNVRKDEQTGAPVVHEMREPMVDVFEETGHVLVVAEMPGIGEEDVRLELVDDVLTISAERGEKKYHKEVLLPQAFAQHEMTYTCRNGVLEATFSKAAREGGKG
jgi:HSP20 family protein